MNKPGSIIAAVAGIAVLSGFGLTHHHTATATHTATAAASTVHQVSHTPTATAAHPARAATPPRTRPPPTRPWCGWPQPAARPRSRSTTRSPPSPPTSRLENGSPTVANHLIFEADARAVRAQANKILTTPALLPAVNRAAYQHMLTDYIVVANLLQPGPGYGTTPQDDTAWNTAMNASSINVS